ncbi:MAG: MFS transporter [Bacteroidaceae bacterium]|nr:MFS transporter [Bacteroides sp.]MBQ8242854.1 MFS transporter [Bacteroidaceae bacterium]MBQ8601226.1 MFS transporter [Bacteroides sp.]
MIKRLLDFYRISSPAESRGGEDGRFRRLRWATFISATLGYGVYYVCRLSMNVVRKPMVDAGVFTESQLGVIGSCLFFVYAVGKLTNGFLADRSNVKRFMSTGLLCSALINLALGFTESFYAFAILWGLNGWFQSMGAASGVVSLSRWFEPQKRGTYYGFWSASHNIGEALTFISIALLVSAFGWRYGMIGAGLVGLAGFALLAVFMRDTPQSQGYLLGNGQETRKRQKSEDFNKAQKAVLRHPAIWILALSSAFMYISRYAVNSWGVFYLEAQKGYDTLDASFIISISSVCGIIGTVLSGVISDKFFRGSRNVPALVFGLMNTVALCMFLLVPGVHFWLDVTAMILFGLGVGALICFLGGLMAVDIAPKNASGAALGVVGIASYIGAGVQDVMSGILIEGNKQVVDGVEVYDFTAINWFWIGAALLSTLLALLVWNAKAKEL